MFFLKETTVKPTNVLSIEQQRERERQRLREEEERRKKLLIKKDHQQIPPTSKFEPLAVDINNDESRGHKSKTPITGVGTFSPHFPLNNGATTKISQKPSSITPLPRTNNHDENDPNNSEITVAAASTVPKKIVIKKTFICFSKMSLFRKHFYLFVFSILHHLLLLIDMNLVKRWVMEILLLYIDQNYVVVIVNMQLK